MPKLITLSGWGQPANALRIIAPGALHLDYLGTAGLEEFFPQLPAECDVLIGWSLGGYVAVRSIASGRIRPRCLVLLSTPFQCVAADDFAQAMPAALMRGFIANYKASPTAAWKSFQALVALGDSREKEIARQLLQQPQPDAANALRWLEILATCSCRDIDFSTFPATFIVHGKKDAVINPAQATAFAKKISHVRYELWTDCAHAPHLHNGEALRSLIEKKTYGDISA